MTVWEDNKRRGNTQNVINLGNFFDWKNQNSVFEDMATFFDMTANLTSGGDPKKYRRRSPRQTSSTFSA